MFSLDFLSDESVVLIPVDDIYFFLTYCEDYLSAFERFLQREANTIRDRYQGQEELSNYEIYLEQLEDFFPNTLRRGLFLAIYSAIEAELNAYCETQRERKKLDKPFTALKGRGIVRARAYLTKHGGIRFPETQWKNLTDYDKLRNCFMHADGRLEDCDKDTYFAQYVSKHPNLQQDYQGKVEVKQGYCEEVIQSSRAFFKALDESLLPTQQP